MLNCINQLCECNVMKCNIFLCSVLNFVVFCLIYHNITNLCHVVFFMCNISVLNKVCYVLGMVYNTHFNFIYLINKKVLKMP